MAALHHDGAAAPGLAAPARLTDPGSDEAHLAVGPLGRQGDTDRLDSAAAPRNRAAVRAVADPLDLVLSRLEGYRLRKSGLNRWRACCPVCGERNPSTLSIGVGDNGSVLLKCFKAGCDPDRIASAIGLEVSDLFTAPGEPGSGASPLTRRRMLSAQQALDLLDAEAFFVLVAAENMAQGIALTNEDRARLAKAAKRITGLRDEVMS